MKQIAFLFFCLLFGSGSYAQNSSDPVKFPRYINDSTIPDFSIVVTPDSSGFTKKNLKKNKPTLVMVFSPDCGHCQQVTKSIVENMEHFKNAQILMVTWMPYKELVPFSKQYGTIKYPNITLGQDPNDFFYGYYEVHRYPKLIVYNKNGDYVSDYDGNFEIEKVWKDLDVE